MPDLCEHEWARLHGRRWCPKCGADGGAAPGVAHPERHSEAYDPGPRRRIGGQYFDVDDVPPRGDRDY